MTPRLTSAILVNALMRRVHAEGGNGAVLARGDDIAGAILILTYDRGRDPAFLERGFGPAGNTILVETGPKALADEGAVAEYWQRRRASDPDLWVIELDIADAKRFAAETIAIG